jgi:transcriptional regulator with XRE-family HTH domain
MLPSAVAETRHRLGWTQAELGAKAGVSQSQVSRFESQRIEVVSLSTVARFLDSMDIRASLVLDHPLVDRADRQRDAAHARCVAYVAGRIGRMGWEVRPEIEVHHGRSHGWIDVLGFNPSTRSALVVEVKTELPDLGAVQRTLGWYSRMAWVRGRSIGWPIQRVGAALLVLATEANEARLAENAALTRQAFPVRSRAMSDWLSAPITDLPGAALALVDPRSRRVRWLIPTASEGRRSAVRYSSSADFLRRSRG